jgi:hypothetical protein
VAGGVECRKEVLIAKVAKREVLNPVTNVNEDEEDEAAGE